MGRVERHIWNGWPHTERPCLSFQYLVVKYTHEYHTICTLGAHARPWHGDMCMVSLNMMNLMLIHSNYGPKPALVTLVRY